MTLPIRQKSTQNPHFPTDNRLHKLKTSQLFTEPDSKTYSLPLTMLALKYDTSNTQSSQFSQKIKFMLTRYYDASLIYMENEIDYHESSEYLKRFYFQQEFEGKIKMLGDYYKYHHDHPRIFLEEVEKVMTNFQQDQRELQYIKVRQKIEEERLANQQKQNRNLQKQDQKLKHINSKKNILHYDNKKHKKTQFILENILLQYADSSNQPDKKPILQKEPFQRQQKIKTSVNPAFASKQKTLQKSCSSTIKKMYSSNQQHQKSRQNSKNNLKHVFTLKNNQTKEIKNLQSKYTQILNQLFKKKRSSSKPDMIYHKIETLKNKNTDKVTKQDQFHTKSDLKKYDNGSTVVQNKDCQQNKPNNKIVRSKSQATINLCKSSKLLKTFKAKINENPINLNSKPTKNIPPKQTKKFKNEQQEKQPILKRDKFSSSKSLRQIMNKKPLKAVKVFQITKQDLLVNHNTKNNSLQKEKVNCQLRQHKQQNVGEERSENRENQENEIPVLKDKSRTKSFKPSIQPIRPHKTKESKRKTQKEPKALNMFGRVLKTKIRG